MSLQAVWNRNTCHVLVSYGLAVLSRADSSMARVARCNGQGSDRVALTLKTREVAARCMLLYAGPYRREPPFPRRAGAVMREDHQATAEEAALLTPYRVN